MLDSVVYFLKNSFNCCMANKKHTVMFILLIFLFAFIFGLLDGIYAGIAIVIYIVLYNSYGMQLTREVINGREELPKFNFKDIKLGIWATIIFAIYIVIQTLFLAAISFLFDFPRFEIEEFVFNFQETFHLIYNHNPISSLLFFALSIVILYITVFFLEIALAQLADGGSLRNSFNLKLLKEYIEKIGWYNYAKDYTIVLIILLILTLLEFAPIFNDVLSIFSYILIFIVEFCAIGLIFRKTKT